MRIQQCCDSGIIYFQIRIRLQLFRVPHLEPDHVFKAFLSIIKKHLIINQKGESTNYLSFSISHYSPSVILYSLESAGLKLEVHFKSICSFILAGPGTNNSGSGSGIKFRIRIHNTGIQISIFLT